jgi:hypothetical protein
MFRIRTARPLASIKTWTRSPTWAGRSIRVFSSCATRRSMPQTSCRTEAPPSTAVTWPVKDAVSPGIGSRPSPACWAPSVPRTIPRPRSSCLEVPANGAAGTGQAHARHSHEAPLAIHIDTFSCSSVPWLSRRVNKLTGDGPPAVDESQKRVTLEKLKSRSVIAGTRSLPVSDVIASAGLVKAAIRLKARRGLS